MHASRALVGSLIVNAALLALLLALAPPHFERAATAPVIVDVAIALPPQPPPPVLATLPVIVAAPHRVRAAPPALPVPTTTATSPGDLAADSGSGAGGNGDGDAGRAGGGAVAPPGPAATMPIPIGSRSAQLPYTRDALVAHAQGNVLVRVLVGVDGKVHQTALVHGLGHGLDAIALALAAKLAFEPARDALGAPTTAQITWRFHFTPPPL